jgi:hypothetical protein
MLGDRYRSARALSDLGHALRCFAARTRRGMSHPRGANFP